MAADIKGKKIRIDQLMATLLDYGNPRRKGRAPKRIKTMPVFIEAIADRYIKNPDVTFTDEELRKFNWFDYQCTLHSRKSAVGRQRRSLAIMRDTINLFHDIKIYGLKAPLDLWRDGKRYVLERGWRRIIILDALNRRGLRKYQFVPVRIFKDRASLKRHTPSLGWVPGPLEGASIYNLAVEQFREQGGRSTDKYWVHNYTQYYDTFFNSWQNRKIKLLEIGVARGASLILWEKFFKRGKFYGVDKSPRRWRRSLKGHKRIKIFVGNQNDTVFLKDKVAPAGPYNIIIDDGSHVPEDQLASFTALWPHIRRGGFYVIEDLHGNYGGHKAKHGPKMMEVIQNQIKNVVADDNPGSICAIHAYYNIVFIQKRD